MDGNKIQIHLNLEVIWEKSIQLKVWTDSENQSDSVLMLMLIWIGWNPILFE